MRERQRFDFNIVYIAFLFVWPVLRTFYFHIDGAGRADAIFTLLAIVVNGKYLLRGPAVMKVWIIWVVYALINLYFKGYQHDYPFFWWTMVQLVCPLVSMLIVYNCALYDKDKLIKYISYLFIFYIFIGAAKMSVIEGGRMSNDMGNSFLNNAIFIVPFLSLITKQKKISFPYYFIIGFVFFIILISGERKALAGILLMIMGFLYARNSGRSVFSIIMLFLLVVVSVWGITYIMDNTVVGERINDQFAYSDYENSLFLTLMGDRSIMYDEGFVIFLQHPWTGIGLTNFIYHPLNSRGLTFHTEYMVELTECGIIGSALFLLFYLGMITRLIKMIRNKRALFETIILSSSLLAVIVINFSAWTYSLPFYFMFFGLLHGYYDSLLQEERLLRLKEV